MKIIDCIQGSQEWYNARMGIVTASNADCLITAKGKVKEGQAVETYMHRLLAERLLHWSPDQLNTFPMDQGKLIETICVPWYEFEYDTKVQRVGFCLSDDGRIGCSPDGLLPDGSGLEIKSPQAPNHIKYLLENKIPDEYLPQIHFSMFVTGAPHWTFVSYSMQLPPLVVRVPLEKAWQLAITDALRDFLTRYDAAYDRIQSLRQPKAA